MGAFTVETESLRTAADSIDGTSRTVVGRGVLVTPTGCGHAGLDAAVSGFAIRLGALWDAEATTVHAVAEGLRSTARVYETGDGGTGGRLRPGGGSF